MAKVRVLIVEDEIIVAKDIAARLNFLGYEIVSLEDNSFDTLEVLKKHEVDLCLLDINIMGEQDGIELAREIKEKYSLPIIFLTSYSDGSTFERAKRVKPSAYMLKPFNEKQLQMAIELAISNYSKGKEMSSAADRSEGVDETDFFTLKESIFLKKKERYEKVALKEILWVEAQSNYTLIKTENEKYLLSNTLNTVGARLRDPFFVRVHRSYIVNLNHVTSFEGNMIYVMGNPITVSKIHREEIFKRFNKF